MTQQNRWKQGWVFPLFSPDSDNRLSLNFHRFVIKLWYTKCGPLDNTVYRCCVIALKINKILNPKFVFCNKLSHYRLDLKKKIILNHEFVFCLVCSHLNDWKMLICRWYFFCLQECEVQTFIWVQTLLCLHA